MPFCDPARTEDILLYAAQYKEHHLYFQEELTVSVKFSLQFFEPQLVG